MSGVVSTLEQGSVVRSGSVTLSGQQITSEQYFFELPHGILAQFSQGTLLPNYVMSNLELGSVITTGHGTLTYVPEATGDAERSLAGSFATFAAGSVTYAQPLSGQASTSAYGTLVRTQDFALTGGQTILEMTSVSAGNEEENTYILSQQGTTAFAFELPITGSESILGQGTVVAITSGKTAELIGTELSIEQSSVESFFTWGISAPATSQVITSEQYNVGAPLTLPLVGESSAVEKGFFGWDMTITGQGITSATGNMIWVPTSENTFPMFGFPTITVGQGNLQVQREDETDEGDKFLILSGSAISSDLGILTPHGTDWVSVEPSTETTWTPKAGPTSSWVREGDSSTSWTRKNNS